jgi:hypothetical protein
MFPDFLQESNFHLQSDPGGCEGIDNLCHGPTISLGLWVHFLNGWAHWVNFQI